MLESTEPFGERELMRRHFRFDLSTKDSRQFAEVPAEDGVDPAQVREKVWIETDASPIGGGRSRLHAKIDGRVVPCDQDVCRGEAAAWRIPNSKDIFFLRREGFADAETGFYRWTTKKGTPKSLSGHEDALPG